MHSNFCLHTLGVPWVPAEMMGGASKGVKLHETRCIYLRRKPFWNSKIPKRIYASRRSFWWNPHPIWIRNEEVMPLQRFSTQIGSGQQVWKGGAFIQEHSLGCLGESMVLTCITTFGGPWTLHPGPCPPCGGGCAFVKPTSCAHVRSNNVPRRACMAV